MKWHIALPVALGILAVILIGRHAVGDGTQDGPQAVEQVQTATVVKDAVFSSKPNAETKEAVERSSTGYFIPITGGRPRPRATRDPFFRVAKTRDGLPIDGDPFVAESAEEQRWLDRNGYPNAEQLKEYSVAPHIVLEQAAAHGDSVAEVMLTARQLHHGDASAGGKLLAAGVNGSSYALSLLSSYLSDTKRGNPELGYAIARVVELRGDWRAGITRDLMLARPLSPLQRARAEGEAFKLLDNFRNNSPIQPYVQPRPMSPLENENG